MKILQVSKYYPPFFGGLEKVVYDMSENLSNDKTSCDILCSNHDKGNSVENNENYSITRVPTYGTFMSTPMSPKLLYMLWKMSPNYDIIHIHLPNPVANLAAFLIRGNAKIVVHWHCDASLHGIKKLIGKLYNPFQNILLSKADKIITTSPKLKAESSYLQKYLDKTEVVPIGIKEGELIAIPSKVDEIKDTYKDKKIIFSLGRLVSYKGYERLINSAQALNDNCVILIGGSGPLTAPLKDQIKELGLEKKVFLLGAISFEDIGSYYEACDLYCFPSITCSEAFGVVQIEAMSFKKPIIGTKIKASGVDWVNVDGETGVNIAPNDTKGLTLAITKILSDDALYQQYSKNAFNRFLDNFTVDKTIKKTKEIYDSIL